jgi:hypothetical protein
MDELTHEWEGLIALLDTPSDDHQLLINAYGRVLNRLRDRETGVMLPHPNPAHGLVRVGKVDGYLTHGNELRAIGAVDLALIEATRPDVAASMRAGKRIPVALQLRGNARLTWDRDEIASSIWRGLAAATLQDDLDRPSTQRPQLDEPDVAKVADEVLRAYADWEPQWLVLDSPSPWPDVGIELDDFTGSLDVRTRKPPRPDA